MSFFLLLLYVFFGAAFYRAAGAGGAGARTLYFLVFPFHSIVLGALSLMRGSFSDTEENKRFWFGVVVFMGILCVIAGALSKYGG